MSIEDSKHAYLILAHGEFELLSLLVTSLDDPRNDIYVHIDAKVTRLPELKTEHAGLVLIEDRCDVRWGDISVVEAEFALFRAAYAAEPTYSYYHLISGVDLPLKSQDYIHDFCARHQGTEFIGFYRGADKYADIDRKVRLHHLFPKDFRGSGISFFVKRILRALCIRLQLLLGCDRFPQKTFDKGTQWLSITESLVEALLSDEQQLIKQYRNTFCSDEIVIHSFVAESRFADKVYDRENEARSSMRHIGWHDGVLKDFEEKDIDHLRQSEAFFARKFNSRNMGFIRRVLELSQQCNTDTDHDSNHK